jgi:hypothetical protein
MLERMQHAAPNMNEAAMIPLRKAVVIDPAPVRERKR